LITSFGVKEAEDKGISKRWLSFIHSFLSLFLFIIFLFFYSNAWSQEEKSIKTAKK